MPPGVIDEAVADHHRRPTRLTARLIPRLDRDNWPQVREAMCRAILASATPEREDRLFPGDVAQFQPGGSVNFAYGAAGVLYALDAAGAPRLPEYEDWLRRHALAPDPGTGIGFYDGLHGVAYVLDLLGHRQDAIDTVDLCLREKWDSLELGLFGGLAGVGLNLLHLGGTTREATFTDLAFRIVDICADRLGGPDDVPEISGGANPRAGLMYGSAGPALLFLRAYEQTGDAALLDRAAVALRQDLRRCSSSEDGTLQVTQGWRTLPYLDEGSVGIALILARYLTHRDDEDFRTALSACRLVTQGRYFVQSGLFTGRAGMVATLGTGLRTRAERSRHRPGRADPRTGLARAALRRRPGLPRQPAVQALHGLRDRHGRSPVRDEHRAARAAGVPPLYRAARRRRRPVHGTACA